MKNFLKLSFAIGLICGFCQHSLAQQQITPVSISTDLNGINERPAIENLIELWNPGTFSTYSSASFIVSSGDNPTLGSDPADSYSDASNNDDTKGKGKGEEDDLDTKPRVLELLEKQSVIHENRELVLYPNPSQGIINVSLKDSEVNMIEIFSVSGSLIYRCANGAFAGQNIPIDLSDMAKGIYMLHVTGVNTVSTKKFALR